MIFTPFIITDAVSIALEDTRARIRSMLDERMRLESQSAMPSEYWLTFCSAFDYMLDLSPHSLAKIRLHTFHLTSDNYLTYYFAPVTFNAVAFGNELRRNTADLPAEYLLSEPRDGGMGVEIDGQLITTDLGRFQEVINSLYRTGILRRLKAADRRNMILEIGAGYGGLAYHLSQFTGDPTYVIVDLPEVLFFSACYLRMAYPDRKFLIYSPDDHMFEVARWEDYDFVFVPNYRKELVKSQSFDLVINMESLQEMRRDQVEEYLLLIQEICSGVFYSYNQDANVKNAELSNLTDMLKVHFDIKQIATPDLPRQQVSLKARLRKTGKHLLVAARLLSPPYTTLPHHEYLCTPKSSRPS